MVAPTPATHTHRRASEPLAVLLEGVSLVRGGRSALSELDLAVPTGEVVGLIGQNGAGKTSLLALIAGLVYATSGTTRIFGRPPGRHARLRVGLLSDPPMLLPGFKTRDLLQTHDRLALHTSPRRRPGDGHCDHLIQRLELLPLLERQVSGLSHGERQRVGLAEVLLGRPELLLLDEPTNGLDPVQQVSLAAMLEELRSDTTILLSSHQLHSLGSLCHRVILLHEGRVAGEARAEAPDRILLGLADIDGGQRMAGLGPEISVQALADGRLQLSGPDTTQLLQKISARVAEHRLVVTELTRVPALSPTALEAALLAHLAAGAGSPGDTGSPGQTQRAGVR